jgi:hypothetical protein
MLTETKEINTNASFAQLEKGLPFIDMKILLANSYHPIEIFNEALNVWNQNFTDTEIVTHLERLCTVPDIRNDLSLKPSLDWLGRSRKSGTRLNAAWKMVSIDHEPPKILKQTIKQLGKFKDQVWHLTPEQRLPGIFLECYQNSCENTPIFTPSTYESFMDNYFSIIFDIKQNIAKPEMTLEEHHDIRKKLRNLKHFFQLVYTVTNNPDAHLVDRWLGPISDEMGKEHDAFVVGEFEGSLENDADTTKIRDQHLQMIHAFIQLHDGLYDPQKYQNVEKPKVQTESINFAKEAVVTRWITYDTQKQFIDLVTGESVQDQITRFSLMKYGHMGSIRQTAYEMAYTTIQNENFITTLTRASQNKQTVFITSPGIFNVPSASNLLLAETAKQLNIAVTNLGSPPLKIAEQARLGESTLDYASQSIGDRKNDTADRSIIPKMFKENVVIYLDDIYISGTVAERAKQRIIHAGAQNVFFLFSMRVDPELVAQTDGKIEDTLNRIAVDGSLTGLLPVISDEFIPTQKTLRDFYNPKNIGNLSEFIQTQIDPSVTLQLYIAQAQNDFKHRWDGIYCPAISIVESYLKNVGLIDKNGLIIP